MIGRRMRPTDPRDRPRCSALLLAILVPFAGCGFLGETDDADPLPGERISVMSLERVLSVDSDIAERAVVLPDVVRNVDWPQPGGDATHALQHPALGAATDRIWYTDIGAGSNDDQSLLASPVVSGNRIYVLDTDGVLQALDPETGNTIWRASTTSRDEDDVNFRGAITTGGDRVFAGTGAGLVIAFAADSGEELWRVPAPGPVRSAPSYRDGRIFVTTIANEAVALRASDGTRIWTHAGITEDAALLGRGSPAVTDDVVLLPYSSGEIFALKPATGRVYWVDNLARTRRADAVTSLGDIRGHPVVGSDTVFAASHSGQIAALDLTSGERIWEQAIGAAQTPWLAGEFLFVLSNNAELVCLTSRDGRIRWFTRLPEFEDPEDRDGPIQYAGPVLAGERLFVISSRGELYRISPHTGEILDNEDVAGVVYLPPIVADGTLYLLDDDGGLHAYR